MGMLRGTSTTGRTRTQTARTSPLTSVVRATSPVSSKDPSSWLTPYGPYIQPTTTCTSATRAVLTTSPAPKSRGIAKSSLSDAATHRAIPQIATSTRVHRIRGQTTLWTAGMTSFVLGQVATLDGYSDA
jgi:hypothetical protein